MQVAHKPLHHLFNHSDETRSMQFLETEAPLPLSSIGVLFFWGGGQTLTRVPPDSLKTWWGTPIRKRSRVSFSQVHIGFCIQH